MAEYISRASQPVERQKMRHILRGEYFRRRDALGMKNMLLRACKFARSHLDEYFPTMRQEILFNSETLENATKEYWIRFEELVADTVPTH